MRKQHACEQRRLVAAGSGADFQDRVLLVGGVLGQKLDPHPVFEILHALADVVDLVLRQRAHLGIGRAVVHDLLEVGQLLGGGAPGDDAVDDRLELGMLLREAHELLARQLLAAGHIGLDCRESGHQMVQFFLGDQITASGGRPKLT